MVIAGHPRLVQPVELLRGEEAHGGAQAEAALPGPGLIGVDGLIKLRAGQAPAGGDDGEAVDPLPLVQAAQGQNVLLGEEVILLAVRVVVGGLGAVLAVLRAPAAAGVDDGAQVHMVAHTGGADAVGSVAQLL